MNLKQELPLLKARARAIEARLDLLTRRTREIQRRSPIPLYSAVVDSGKCLSCGICETTCPVEAITVKKTARINPARCIGCGRCADECPQRAITFRPAGFNPVRQAGAHS